MKSPPLKALRTFDAAARHSSFTAAAEALSVTHGAVSRQIQQLEEFLGRPLFKRVPRGVELTPAGQQFAKGIRRAFKEIGEAVEAIRAKEEDVTYITVSTLPGLASRWLFPRLPRFQKRYPEYQVRVSVKVRLVDFETEEVDMAIRYGGGDWPGVHSQRLFGEETFPVCAPSLLEGPEGLKAPDDLARFELLHEHSYRYWATWLKFAGAERVDPTRGQIMDDPNVMLQACIAGQGVALSMQPLVQEDLEAGRLVKPFDIAMTKDLAYYAVCPPAAIRRPEIKAMIEWLMKEAEATRSSR